MLLLKVPFYDARVAVRTIAIRNGYSNQQIQEVLPLASNEFSKIMSSDKLYKHYERLGI